MRLTQKKIEEILLSVLGETGLPLINELLGKENVSEFDLAKKIKYDIKVVRKMLYLLYNHNLVGFTRKKDKQKGWYIYYWTLLPNNIKFSYYKMKREALQLLKQQLEAETAELFFVCPNKCVRLNFDQAMEFEFHCPECGELITQDSSEERISSLKSQIRELEEDLNEIQMQRQERRKKVKEHKKLTKTKKAVSRKKDAEKKTKSAVSTIGTAKIAVSKRVAKVSGPSPPKKTFPKKKSVDAKPIKKSKTSSKNSKKREQEYV